VATGEKIGAINTALAELLPRLQASDLGAIVAMKELCLRLLATLLEHSPYKKGPAFTPEFMRMLPVLQFVQSNLRRVLTREELARQAHLSPTRFHYVFKRVIGQAPMEYVQTLRLNLARRLLVQRNDAIYEIAARTGFADPYYFCRIFKARVGQTPTAFRKTFRAEE
jgi:AraC-like DNA-binding protein